jgi:diguanylate cyclase (GGDEF)-like protein
MVPPLLEPLLAVHSAPSTGWLADAAGTAAERGLGALYGLLYLTDSSGQLVGERPASKERMRSLAKVNQALDTDLTALRFEPGERSALASTMQGGRAAEVRELAQAIPLAADAEMLCIAQRQLGVAQAWLAPLQRGGESLGLLLLLMPEDPPAPLSHADILGQHVAVAVSNLRTKDAGRKRGELDAVRWVYDEWRFLEQLAQEVHRAQRHGRPLSILLLSVQNLTELRVRYGRFLAERVLRQVAGRLDDAMRDTDFLGASQEDGFAAILVETDQGGAERARERLLAGLGTMELPEAELPGLDVQLACATATLPQDGRSAEELAAAAEARLGRSVITTEDVASAI